MHREVYNAKKKTIFEIKYCYISTLYNNLEVRIKSINHCVIISQSIKLQPITKNKKEGIKMIETSFIKIVVFL